MSATTYHVGIRYGLDDKASAGLKGIGGAADKAARSTGGLRDQLKLMAATAVGFGGLALGKKLLVDFNSQMDSMRIGMQTVLSMQLKKPFAEARGEVEGLFSAFQEMSKKSPATTADFANMANNISGAVLSAGGSLEDLKRITQGAVVGASAFGIEAGMAGLDIKQMLSGNVGGKDYLAQQLLSSQGISQDEYNEKAKADKKFALDFLKKALGSSQVLDAADAMGESFSGVMSTFKDQIEITFGKVGLPLMKAITAEVKSWNAWIEKNEDKIATFAKQAGGALRDGFGFLRDAAAYLVENRETLLTLAKAFAVFAGVKVAGGMLGGLAGALGTMARKAKDVGGALETLSTGAGGAKSGLLGLANALGGPAGLVFLVGALAAAITGIVTWWRNEKRQEQERRDKSRNLKEATFGVFDNERRRRSIDERMAALKRNAKAGENWATSDEFRSLTMAKNDLAWRDKAALKEALGPLMSQGIVTIEGEGHKAQIKFNENAVTLQRTVDGEAASRITMVQDALERERKRNAMFDYDIWKERNPLADPYAADGKAAAEVPSPTRPEINVKINKIEVTSDDPDRFVLGLARSFEEVGRHPTSAQSILGGQ